MLRRRLVASAAALLTSGAVIGTWTYLRAQGTQEGAAPRGRAAVPVPAEDPRQPNASFRWLDISDGPRVPGEIHFDVHVNLWHGIDFPFEPGDDKALVRVDIYRPGDKDLQDKPLATWYSGAATIERGVNYTETFSYARKMGANEKPYHVSVRMTSKRPDGPEEFHSVRNFTYKVD